MVCFFINSMICDGRHVISMPGSLFVFIGIANLMMHGKESNFSHAPINQMVGIILWDDFSHTLVIAEDETDPCE